MESSNTSGLLSLKKGNDLAFLDYAYGPHTFSDYHEDKSPRISIVLRGHLSERVGNCEEWASPLSVVIKPADAKHANRYGPKGARVISILPRQHHWCNEYDAGFMDRWQWFHGHTHAAAVTRFLSALAAEPNLPDCASPLIELIADLSPPVLDKPATPPSWLSRIAEQLRDECDTVLRIQQLAETAEVHPVYLARAFRRYYGCSPKQFQHAFRLRRAIQQLAEPMPLVQVALDNGYADQSHFSRHLKAETGKSPGNMRRLLYSW